MGSKQNAANSKKNSKRGAHLAPYQFKPGQSGNPSGRPKGSITKYYNEVLERIDPKTGKQRALKVAEAHIDACETNPSFANIILDRTEGTVVQKVAVGELESLPQEMAEGRKRAIEAALKSKKSKEK